MAALAGSNAHLGIEISKTRKYVMPQNISSKKHVSIIEVKLALHFWCLARSISEQNMLYSFTSFRIIVRVAAMCATWQQQKPAVPCFVWQGILTRSLLVCNAFA